MTQEKREEAKVKDYEVELCSEAVRVIRRIRDKPFKVGQTLNISLVLKDGADSAVKDS